MDGREASPAESGGVRLAPGVVVREEALRFSFTTSSGPGGQNVNKRATRAELRVRLADLPLPADAAVRLRDALGWRCTAEGELIIDADEHRSQGRNREACVERLGELVRAALVRPKIRRKTKPSRSAKARRVDEKKRRGAIKKRRSDQDD